MVTEMGLLSMRKSLETRFGKGDASRRVATRLATSLALLGQDYLLVNRLSASVFYQLTSLIIEINTV